MRTDVGRRRALRWGRKAARHSRALAEPAQIRVAPAEAASLRSYVQRMCLCVRAHSSHAAASPVSSQHRVQMPVQERTECCILAQNNS